VFRSACVDQQRFSIGAREPVLDRVFAFARYLFESRQLTTSQMAEETQGFGSVVLINAKPAVVSNTFRQYSAQKFALRMLYGSVSIVHL
jgi:hypothetical protein